MYVIALAYLNLICLLCVATLHKGGRVLTHACYPPLV